MPVQRVSRGFKDISLSFRPHPITRDVIPLKNESAISRSVKNLVLTHLQERPFNPTLGSRIGESLFELMDVGSAAEISDEIRNTIDNFEVYDRIYVEERGGKLVDSEYRNVNSTSDNTGPRWNSN